mmetsp:Transcript_10549/g.45766  ORF Transcript_10549/g.45766 Transcript_10549/m.45766 type:complete len:225 (-) Transcript_10549:57-731(-)
MDGIFSLSFCVTATRTVITDAAGPVSLTFTMGSSMSTSSSCPPPVPARYGLISSSVASTFSSVRSRPPASSWICSTSMISGIFSISLFSIPMRMVTVDDGQLPHAPLSFSLTTSPSISTSSTSPPSAMRYGRTSSSTFSTLSAVSSSFSEIELSPAALTVTTRLTRAPAALPGRDAGGPTLRWVTPTDDVLREAAIGFPRAIHGVKRRARRRQVLERLTKDLSG